MAAEVVTLMLTGDVMLGRGVDQILAHPVDPELREAHVRDARAYVRLAEEVNGGIPAPVDDAWPWGDLPALLGGARPAARIINLETSITRSTHFAPGKPVHYRMSPDNVGAVLAARPDCCVLANNHVLDFGVDGLVETLDVLSAAGVAVAGAGRSVDEATAPAVVPLPGGGRVLVYAVGMPSSGVPRGWAARDDRPGVFFVPGASPRSADRLGRRIAEESRPGDLVVVSVHWGSNWGHDVPDEHLRFADALVEAGADVIHGHSSHHPRPLDVRTGRLVLYGCGDLINDYEGIGGREEYRGDLRLLYLASLEAASGALRELRMVPVQARQMRLHRASHRDAAMLRDLLRRTSRLPDASFALDDRAPDAGPDAGPDLVLRPG